VDDGLGSKEDGGWKKENRSCRSGGHLSVLEQSNLFKKIKNLHKILA
jgi:hypothetical protein